MAMLIGCDLYPQKNKININKKESVLKKSGVKIINKILKNCLAAAEMLITRPTLSGNNAAANSDYNKINKTKEEWREKRGLGNNNVMFIIE
jgi:hypothetical protein